MYSNRARAFSGILAAVAALASIAILVGLARSRLPSRPTRSLLVDQASRRIGAPVGESSITTSYTIRNVGDRTVQLGDPSTTCGCSVASIQPRRIAPGGTAEVQVRGEPPRTGLKRVLIRLPTDANDLPEVTLELVMIGAGKTPYVAFDSRALSFGCLSAKEVPARRSVLIMTRESVGTPPWIDRLASSVDGILVEGGVVEERELGDNVLARTYRYAAILDHGKAGSSIDGLVQAFGKKDGALILELPINGQIRPAVIAEPKAIYARLADDESPQPITLEVTSDSPDFDPSRVETEAIPPSIRVRRLASVRGKASFEIDWDGTIVEVRSTLIFRTGLAESSHLEVPLTLLRTSAQSGSL